MESSNQAHSRKRGVDPNAPNGDLEERKLDSSHNTDDPVTPSPRGSNKNSFDSDDPNGDFEERISPRQSNQHKVATRGTLPLFARKHKLMVSTFVLTN